MNEPDWGARWNDSKLHVIGRFLGYRPFDCSLPAGAILRMDTLQTFFPSGTAILGIESAYAIPFLRQIQRVPRRNVPCPTAHMSQSLRLGEVTLAAAQGCFSVFTLCNIDHRTDHLDQFPTWASNRMAAAMNLFDCSIGCHDSELDVAIRLLKECQITCQLNCVNVFWVYSLQPLVPHRQALLRIKAKEAEHFVGPVQGLSAGAVYGTTASAGQPLCFCQIGFAAPESLLHSLSLLDISICSVPFDNRSILVKGWSRAEQKPAIDSVETA